MSVPLTPSKRAHDRNPAEPNGKGKWQKSTGSYSHNQSSRPSSSCNVLRVLCPASRTVSLGGDGFVSQIQQETGATVKVEETVSGCDERVIVITDSDKETEVSAEPSKDASEVTNADDKGDETKEHGKNDDNIETVPAEHNISKSERATPSLQKALLLIYDRIVESEPDANEGHEESNKSKTYVLRLLVLTTQVGCLLGKGGSVIKQMSSESGAQIRILPRDKLPSCASSSDELVQVMLILLYYIMC